MVAKISGQCMRRNKDIYRVSKYLLHKTLINYKGENSNSLAQEKKESLTPLSWSKGNIRQKPH